MTFNFTTHKHHLLFFLLLISLAPLQAQSKDPSAILQLNSTTQGLLLPRMTTTQRDAIANPADGLMIFNSTTNQFDFYQGTQWNKQMVEGLSTQFRDADGDTYLDVEPTGDTDRLEVFTANSLRMLFAANGSIGIGTATPTANLHIDGGSATTDILSIAENGTELLEIDNNGKLDFKTTNQGIGLPVLTTAQRNAIANPQNGDLIFNDDANKMELYNLSAALWEEAVDNGLPAGFTHDGLGKFGINTNDYDNNRLSIDGNLDFISGNNRISWGNSLDTKIYANGTATKDLNLEADDDMYISPDDDLIIRQGGTTLFTLNENGMNLHGHYDRIRWGNRNTMSILAGIGTNDEMIFDSQWRFRWRLNQITWMTLLNNTGLGIATTNPTTTLSVNGGANKPGGGNWGSFSDRRIKKDIVPYTKGLEEVLQIEPVSYRYNDKSPFKNPDNGKPMVGIIAQDMQKILPNTIDVQQVGEIEDLLSIDSSELIYTLINAIKALKAENEALQARVLALEKE